jgi:hypothetical protein
MRIVKRSYALAFVSGLTALAMGLAVTPVQAKPIERERFRESSSEVIEGFCGDLTVRVDSEVRGTFLLNPHGPDGLAYASEKVHGTQSYTNLANNKTFTEVFNALHKDLKVTDNGDGTLTILGMSTGTRRWYGPEGNKWLFNDSGMFQFEVLVDHGGTPADPSDDEELAFLFGRQVGRGDTSGDLCAWFPEVIG